MSALKIEILSIERQIVSRFIDYMQENGFVVSRGDDGGDEYTVLGGKEAALSLVFSVMDSQLEFTPLGKDRQPGKWVRFIQRNEPDIISDYSTGLASLIDPFTDALTVI